MRGASVVLDRGDETVHVSSRVPAVMVITASVLMSQIASREENSYTGPGPFSFE